MYIYIYTYMYLHMHVYIYVNVYVERRSLCFYNEKWLISFRAWMYGIDCSVFRS